mgnify:CR=1 FL=1
MQNTTSLLNAKLREGNSRGKSCPYFGIRKQFLMVPVACWLLSQVPVIASAQIIPDNTLPNNSIVTPNGNSIEITGGTTVGNNLFHSFEQFSILTNNTAFFNNNLTIESIISRVTGGSVSTIDGLIRANGSANLFLLNPNGMVFGPNASLDIGGSFISSSANSIKFTDGSEFSATNPQEPPLLTINIPTGLQYGSHPGAITVIGPGNNLSLEINSSFAVVRDNRPVGIQVKPGQTLALVGGNVALEGGNLTAPGGRIELGSVQREGLVKLNPTDKGWSLSYGDVEQFQDIDLSQAASLEVSGNGGGEIQVQGRRVRVTEGSAMLADTLAFGPPYGNDSAAGGTLTVRATEALEVIGTAANNPFLSRLSTDVAPEATGNGGNLTIDTERLLVTDGGRISSSTFGEGDAGILRVTASNLEVIGGSRFNPSGLFTLVQSSATGNGGNLTIDTGTLHIADGAQISVSTFGEGNAGALRVQATEAEFLGTAFGLFPSGLFANVQAGAIGKGGNLTINTDSLRLIDGAQLQANTFGQGDGGTLTVQATEVELIGTSPQALPSALLANVEAGAIGKGANLTIDTDSLRLIDGAQLQANTNAEGDGGTLTVQATEVELIGGSGSLLSGLFTEVQQEAMGDGGNLTINTERLRLSDGAQIAATTFGIGDAGPMTVQATEIELIGTSSQGLPSGLFANVEPDAIGNGGDLIINTERLRLSDGAQIAATTLGQGNAGSIEVNATDVELIGTANNLGSGLFANVNLDATANVNLDATGDGGDLIIETQRLRLVDGAQVATITAGSGNGGTLRVQAQEIELIGTSDLGASGLLANAIAGTGDGGKLEVNTDQLMIRDGATISVSNFQSNDRLAPGLGEAGNIEIVANSIELSNSGAETPNGGGITASNYSAGGGNIDISANQITSNRGEITATSELSGGGDIDITSDLLFLSNQSAISTNVNDSTGGGGEIKINSDFVVVVENSNITANAIFGPGGNIEITTQGLFLSPDSQITASSEFGVDGQINISNPDPTQNLGLIPLPVTIINPDLLIATGCRTDDQENVFAVTGRGGLPTDPTDPLKGETIWIDWRDFSATRRQLHRAARHRGKKPDQQPQATAKKPPIIEAQGWIINQNGIVELVPYPTGLELKPVLNTAINCHNLR